MSNTDRPTRPVRDEWGALDIPDEVVGYCNDLDSYADALEAKIERDRRRWYCPKCGEPFEGEECADE